MSPRTGRWLVLGASWLVWLAGSLFWAVYAPGAGAALAGIVPQGLLVLCGSIIVLRAEERRIGWLLAAPGALVLWFYPFGLGGPETAGLVTDSAWQDVVSALGVLVLWPLMHLVIVFPTGHLRTRTDRWFAVLMGVLQVGFAVLGLVDAAGVTALDGEAGTEGFLTLLGLLMLAVLAHRVARYRRASSVEQHQLKWFLVAILGILLFPASLLLGLSEGWFQAADAISTSLWPLAILLAITRYRLYEVDRVLSRTLAYAIVAGVLAGVFVAGVTSLTALLPEMDQLAVATTTVGVMALSSPLLRRVRDALDRRFDRSRYEARRVVGEFSRTIADDRDREAVPARLAEVLVATVGPATVAVWEPPRGVAARRSRRDMPSPAGRVLEDGGPRTLPGVRE